MKPLIGISCCVKAFGIFATPNHAASDSYVRVVLGPVGGIPVLLPAAGEALAPQILPRLDGLILTGSRSNVCPDFYEGPPHAEGTPEDLQRDATTLPLIRAAIAAGVPLLAICRGFQELNVALGGSLHQAVHDVNGHKDHRPRQELPLDEMYGPVHMVSLRGKLRDWVGDDKLMVNSLHSQGIARLADGLKPEAFAEDGLVEAARGPDDAAFCLGVQWHPEWGVKSDPISASLFRRVGAAARGVAAS